ncbi:YdbH domain-containing protein [Sphingomonas sp. SCN 67-18]|uniref:YdbH domain-containing protein n=1 Tax=uncultured Sphingomonas sp. TaxID=158754 RepID=UPI000ADF4B21|nr:YdbH domain-containing protein [Sphingomonas sp. SCN 67-18]
MADEKVSRTGWRARRYAYFLCGVVVVAAAVGWSQRKPIAADFIDAELARRGVAARYDVTEIGLRRQRLEHIVIGDPRAPDLTADWAEVDLVAGFGGVSVRGISAGGVRLRGRLVDGALRMGAVDKLLPAPSDEPFSLPDIMVALDDARMRLDMPAGPVGLKLDGRGNLAGGFRGRLAAVAPRMAASGCAATGLSAYVALSTARRRPALKGPVRLAALDCADRGIALARANLAVDVALNEALDGWRGQSGVTASSGRYGADRLDGVHGTVAFDGNRARTQGRLDLGADAVSAAGLGGQGLRLTGSYAVGEAADGMALSLDGSAALKRVVLDAAQRRAVASLAQSGAGTPVGPLAKALADAVARAAQDMAANADFRLNQHGQTGGLIVSRLGMASASGAQLTLDGGDGVRLGWPAGGSRIDGTLRLAGGGFPEAVVALRQPAPGEPISGVATMAPYAAGGARIALTPVRFSADGAQTRFDTRLTLDGPLGDGRVRGLTLPVSGRLDGQGGFTVNPGCAPLAFTALSVSGLDLQPAQLRLCPVDGRALLARRGGRLSGGVRVDAPRLAGRLGGSPLGFSAGSARYALGDGGFTLADVAVRLGEADRISRLDIAALSGRVAAGAVSGRFSGGSGQIANVPLLISGAEGGWRLRDGALALDGALRVADAADQPRFQPLLSRDVALGMANGRITATGTLREPAHDTAVATIDIVHALGSGQGRALLDVAGITFNDALQPEALTRLTLGVVANVFGTVSGRGEIRWTADGVSSTGDFQTTDMALAAAFGPVTGLSGTIHFTDLLGMETAPGQRVTLKTVNPGILVENGEVAYQLLPGQRVGIEGGRWPFAGGVLTLAPTVLDFEERSQRRLAFTVDGLDAAKFINQFEFENISATGTFDGTIPMIFDNNGGRIENGSLTVRPGGGTLAYVGDVSNAELGAFAKMAFDALKAIRYDRLTIDLNGAIDGEMITQVRFNGVNQGTEAVQTGFFKEFVGLPFLFNIRITAPFRGLLNTARSFTDPSLLIRDNLPPELEGRAIEPVQPHEREPMR